VDINEIDEMPFVMSFRKKVERTLDAEWYNFDHVTIPKSLKRYVKGWPDANEIAKEKKLDFERKVKDSLKDYVESYLFTYKGDVWRPYVKIRGIRPLKKKVTDRELDQACDLPVWGTILSEADKVVKKIYRKSNTFEYKVLSKLTSLSPEEFKLVKTKLKN
jgi:hypothetical protein